MKGHLIGVAHGRPVRFTQAVLQSTELLGAPSGVPVLGYAANASFPAKVMAARNSLYTFCLCFHRRRCC